MTTIREQLQKQRKVCGNLLHLSAMDLRAFNVLRAHSEEHFGCTADWNRS